MLLSSKWTRKLKVLPHMVACVPIMIDKTGTNNNRRKTYRDKTETNTERTCVEIIGTGRNKTGTSSYKTWTTKKKFLLVPVGFLHIPILSLRVPVLSLPVRFLSLLVPILSLVLRVMIGKLPQGSQTKAFFFLHTSETKITIWLLSYNRYLALWSLAKV